MKINLF